jgi:hypothetical protein
LCTRHAALSQAISDSLCGHWSEFIALFTHFFECLDENRYSRTGLDCVGRKMATKSPRSWNAVESSEYVACDRAEARALSQIAIDIGMSAKSVSLTDANGAPFRPTRLQRRVVTNKV